MDDITCVIIFLDVKMKQQDPNIHLQQQYKQAEKDSKKDQQKS